MSFDIVSFTLGLLITSCFFVLSIFIVVATKFIVVSIKEKFNNLFSPCEKEPTLKKKRKPRVKVRTISINPDEVDRVQFKKTS